MLSILSIEYIQQICNFHNFASEQSIPDFLQDLKDGLVEDDMVVLYLRKVVYKFIYLLFAYLKSVV